MFSEFLSGAKLAGGLANFAYRRFRFGKLGLSPEEVIDRRNKWKSPVEEHVRKINAGRREEIVIRDVKRINDYPNLNENEKGISAWFRIALLDTYHSGLILGFEWQSLTRDRAYNAWRYTNSKNGESADILAAHIGYLPYEFIHAIDWAGDDYYHDPQFYCHFVGLKNSPYARTAYAEEKELHGKKFYVELAGADEVVVLSKRRRISRLGL